MIDTTPTQEQVDEIARSLAPDVVRIRFNPGIDWSEHPALYFRNILSDEASKSSRLGEVSKRVRSRLESGLGLSWDDRIPYMRFRSQTEREQLREARWE